jgi:hypothetical protein
MKVQNQTKKIETTDEMPWGGSFSYINNRTRHKSTTKLGQDPNYQH